MEENPYQAIKNNVGGTLNLLNAATDNGVQTFVNVSTDKAVNSRNVMGASKRINELLVRKMARSENQKANFLSVRFGNVFGSSGSVGPIFVKQILSGGPVTVTHPDMTRFMMSISEAAQLVLVASTLPKAQDGIFLLDMGQPIKILDLASVMSRKFGFQKNEIPIQITGIRPGEKIHEVLNTSNETLNPTSNQRILMVHDREVVDDVMAKVEKLITLKPSTDSKEIQTMLQEIVHDYSYSQGS